MGYNSGGSGGSVKMILKDAVATYNDLPITDNSENDARFTIDTDKFYTWSISSASGSLSDWELVGSIETMDWTKITNRPISSIADLDDAVSKKHTQGTDQKLDDGGANEVSVSELKTVVDDTSGTNTGDETALTLGTTINGADEKAIPINADMVGLLNSEAPATDMTLLLHGDSLPVIDSSGNALTADNYHVTSSSVQKVFGAGSLLFNGTDSYLKYPKNTAIFFNGASFTFDFNVYHNSVPSESVPYFHYLLDSKLDEWGFDYDGATNKLRFWAWIGGGYSEALSNEVILLPDTFYHIAIVRDSNKIYFFVNGVPEGSPSFTTYLHNWGVWADAWVGRRYVNPTTTFLDGYIDEFRYCPNVAKWTTSFTPPTEAYSTVPANVLNKLSWTNIKATLKTYFDTLYASVLGADDNYVTDDEKTVIGNTGGINTGDEDAVTLGVIINESDEKATPIDADMIGLVDTAVPIDANTLLLLNFDGTSVVDSSPDAHPMQENGGITLTSADKKFGAKSCDFASGSITATDSSDFAIGTSDFTVEAWVNPDSLGHAGFFDTRVNDPDNGLNLEFNSSGQLTEYTYHSVNSISAGVWQHVCYMRKSGILYFFINGINAGGSFSFTKNLTTQKCRIGSYRNGSSRFYNGKMDEFRFSDMARYAITGFSVPCAEFGSDRVSKLSWSNMKVALVNSGTTLERPTTGLFAGYEYFDTTLGYQIWYDGSNWVDSEGTLVDFVFTITTTGAAVSLTLPLTNVGTFNCKVNWGDGNSSTITSYNDADRIHAYASAGTYTVSISGSCPAFNFRDVSTSASLPITILSWGDVKLQVVSFYGCSNLTTLPSMGDLSNLTTLHWSFQGCSSLATLPADTFKNCKLVTECGDLFNGCTSLTTIPVGLFDDMISVLNMGSVFRSCSGITAIPSGLFKNCVSATSFSESFRYCTALTKIGTEAFNNCNSVTSFNLAFGGCTSLITVPVDLFKHCASVTSFDSCFVGCTSLASIPVGLFKNLNKVTDFDSVLESTALTLIPEDTFEGCTANTIIKRIFMGCSALTAIPAGLFADMTSATSVESPFRDCSSITEIPAGLFDGFTAVTAFSGVFDACSALTAIPLGLFDDMTLVTNFSWNFQNCTALTAIPATLFNLNTVVTNVSGCFNGCSAITSAVPVLWSRGGGYSVITSYNVCFKNCTSASNYAAIPAGWK